ncbi:MULTISPECIES: RNA polymerase sigma factor [Actinoalloteichus]|uniref:RNA polymerase sigma-70 factor, sigma-E family n=1 Tax=Actinoalloteichus fjordicus TaxID=1612552 RepID=A0AAC9PSG1_9PSEU|nr:MULTISPECIES: SigE family RNA polymerase sigma factor [Actinoalloteichus]APU14796.1 RNA polymerase sigma-70 factor, sigma-E family [Actinoalloteichus fjordicus]APU20767.1 RNA polymerase sigma-70 factor, sigma-E family [Actinoalloteichus sp. GBA129-24]
MSASHTHSSPAATSDDEAFRRCFDEYVEGVRFTARLLCGDWHRAEDLTQSAFLKVYLAWPRLYQRDRLGGYLRQVVVRTFVSEHRRLWRRREWLTDSTPERPAEAAPDDDRIVLLDALATLPARQRAVLVLRYWHDLGISEAAAALGCTAGTVKSQTFKALATLRTRLGDQFAERVAASSSTDGVRGDA